MVNILHVFLQNKPGSSGCSGAAATGTAGKFSGMVVAVYEDEWFPAEICQDQSGVAKGYCRLSYMAIRGVNVFAWPERRTSC